MTRSRIAVVGGGIAGLACALAAARAGADVHLYEADGLDAAVPGHVDVVPNMLRDLARLGVADACVRGGFAYRRISAIGHRGARLFSLDVPNLAGPRYPSAIGMARADLHDVLTSAAQAEGVALRFGAAVRDVVALNDGGVQLHCANGPDVRADLVVLATGATDELRERLIGAGEPQAGTSEWLYLQAPRTGIEEVLCAAAGSNARATVVPVNSTTASVQLMLRQPIAVATSAAAKALLSRFPGSIGALSSALGTAQAMTRRRVQPALLAARWARGNVMVVGDGAHTLPLHLGQSAAQALEDAVVLGELLMHDLTCEEVARRWYERRLPRVREVMGITLRAAQWSEAPDIDTDLLRLTVDLYELVGRPA